MSSAPDIQSRRQRASALPLIVDRVACTGHGICASLLPEQVSLDEWGYPIVHSAHVEPELGAAAIRLCPAGALAWHTASPQGATRPPGDPVIVDYPEGSQ